MNLYSVAHASARKIIVICETTKSLDIYYLFNINLIHFEIMFPDVRAMCGRRPA